MLTPQSNLCRRMIRSIDLHDADGRLDEAEDKGQNDRKYCKQERGLVSSITTIAPEASERVGARDAVKFVQHGKTIVQVVKSLQRFFLRRQKRNFVDLFWILKQTCSVTSGNFTIARKEDSIRVDYFRRRAIWEHLPFLISCEVCD